MSIFGGTFKDQITTICALLYVIVIAVQEAIAKSEGQDINWVAVATTVVVAVIGYYTGKSGTGAAKVP